jgi:hypothetical protein
MGDGSQITAIFGAIGFVVLAAGLGISAYRVSVVRRRAEAAGESPTKATLRALAVRTTTRATARPPEPCARLRDLSVPGGNAARGAPAGAAAASS